jgi:2-polyprenyl-3-methyl-5-hydroxy-6-metoxy-1,4-benzoquinol methylase
MSDPVAAKSAIKVFWETNPLFVGEASVDPYSREFYQDHEKVYRDDVFAGQGFPPRYFPFPAGAQVLDIGCGPGIWARELARRGYATTAIDLTMTAVSMTRQSLRLLGLSANVVEGDAERLPFKNAAFDGIISHGVIHHTPDTAMCVREIARVLRPGGLAVVSVYYRTAILRSSLLSRLAGFSLAHWVKLPGRGRDQLLRSGDPNEIVRMYDGAGNPLGRAFTREELQSMFEASGLRVTHTERYYFPRRAFGRLGRMLSPIHPFLAKRFGLMITVVAQKAH